jgi:acyl carrier protein
MNYSEGKTVMEQDKEKIRQFLTTLTGFFDLEDGMDLINGRIIDSIQALQLVSFLEREFGIEVSGEELDIDNFYSVNAIANFIQRKRQGG